ncbi:MAG: PBP1A family penicillin-binding protein [Ignavibacterium sp.]|nr:PBP1A family penicillin-binding protein [Ignavibacterium sp.]MDW8375862.1 PBP1A family penicillin-binding protein [Ignavibacteriales bacterium]
MEQKKNSTSKKKRNIIIISLISFFLLFLIYIIAGLPSLEELENPQPPLASKVMSADGELIGQFFIENRIETNIDSLPKHLIDALIATEDRNFFDHWGVDLTRFVKAMIKNIITFSFAEGEGASTITQQCAKNLYKLKSGRENAFDKVVRKIREWFSAVQIERNFTKKEILELYLNVSYFGRGAYGIESAAKVYFDKKAKDLNIVESALLVALLKSSEYYDPIKNYQNALRRRNVVLNNMYVCNYLNEKQLQELKQLPITLTTARISATRTEAPHFLEYIRLQMQKIADKFGFDLYRDGLTIYTSLDLRMQRIANRAVAKHISEYQQLFDKNWDWNKNKSLLSELIDQAIKSNNEYINTIGVSEKAKVYNSLKNNQNFIDSIKKAVTKIESGFVVIDPTNGQIKALVGGTNLEFGRGLNHVTGIKRQPGSAFKPIIYATAIENGYFPAYTILNQKFNHNGWSPSNADNKYSGYETLRWGLAFSVNVIAGRMTISEIAPPSQVIKIANKMGIKSKLDPYPSIALGTFEISPLELTAAYGCFANNGILVEPISILKIEDRNGVVIDEYSPNISQAISPATASIMANMMQDVVNYGTGAGVRRYFQYPAAGKTGTTQKFSDAWFVGYTPKLVAGVWVGFDDHRIKFTSWYGQGAKAALPIWAMFMQGVYKELNLPVSYFELDQDVESAQFCKESMDIGDARLATENCPTTYTDIVNRKKLPLSCDLHSGGKIIREGRRGESGWKQ